MDGLDTLTIPVGAAPRPPPPGRGVTARLVVRRVRKKARLMVDVFDAATGALKNELPSPFQKPAFRNIRVSVLDSSGDGAPDQVVITVRKGRRNVSRAFPG